MSKANAACPYFFYKENMPRPKIKRILKFEPDVTYFKPRGVPMRYLEEVEIKPDEVEALKLHDVDGLPQTEAAEKMGISQPTFARILNRAYRKVAQALIQGRAIKLDFVPPSSEGKKDE